MGVNGFLIKGYVLMGGYGISATYRVIGIAKEGWSTLVSYLHGVCLLPILHFLAHISEDCGEAG